MPPSARRRQPKHAAAPIDLEEIEHDPGFRGMLSFFEVSPGERAALLAKRDEAEGQIPMAQRPLGESPMGGEQLPAGELPTALPPAAPDLFPGTGDGPSGQLPAGLVPYMDVEGRGKRPLRFCHTAQDGHTASEQLAYQALWSYAQRHGRPENSGSVFDLGLSQLCALLSTDHKNVKRLVGALRDKLAIEVVRQPDYRLAIPTRYRIFDESEILQRRREAGLVWVIRTRAVRFVDLEAVNRLLTGEAPTGKQSMGQQPMGQQPDASDTFPASLAANLKKWLPVDDDAVQQIWRACQRGAPDCTEDEVHWFCRSKEPLIRSGRVDDPVALLIRSAPQVFAKGGGSALLDYRKEQARAQERERKRQRQVAMMVLDDAESTEAEMTWAKEVLAGS
jgi:hypothetical protein